MSQHRTGSKLNASAEKHTSGNDLAAPAARVMNSANCAYHRLQLLVLIAMVTTCLERRWALLPRAQHRQVILICGLSMCHSEGKSWLRNASVAYWSKKHQNLAGHYRNQSHMFLTHSASIKSKLRIQSNVHQIQAVF